MLIALSLALALTPQQADDRLRSVAKLQVEPDLYRRVETPFVIEQGAMSVAITEGVMVPVFSGRFAGEWEERSGEMLRQLREKDKNATLPSADDRGDRQLVGFVWLSGDADVAVSFPRKADAIELASRQVMYAGAERSDMLEVARRRSPFTTKASEGLVLSVDPALDELFLGGEDVDPYEVVVYDKDPPLGQAGPLLQARLDLWEEVGLDWQLVLAEERLAREGHAEAPTSWLVDLHTSDRYARVSEQPTQQDRWLAAVDRHGRESRGWTSEVYAAGRTPQGYGRRMRVSGVPAPPTDPADPTSASAPESRMVPEHATVRVLANPPRNELSMEVEVSQRVRLRAQETTQMVTLRVPRVETDDGSFEWVRAELPDGTPLVSPEQVNRKASNEEERPEPKPKPKPREREREWQRLRDLDRNKQNVRLVFPEPLEAGDVVEVDLQWKDTWPTAHLAQGPTGVQNLGTTTGLMRFLPSIDGADIAWDYQLTVGLPEGSPFQVAVSGPVAEEVLEDGWQLVRTGEVTHGRYPNIIIGKYDQRVFPSRKGMPSVRVMLNNSDKKQLQDMAVEARAAMGYMARYLPPYMLGEYDVVESYSAINHFTWVAPHGMMLMQKMQQTSVGGEREDLGRAVFAHEIAHQWWGQMAQPGSLDDRWMIETFAEVFSCMYVAKANEKVDPCVDELERNRKEAEGETWFADVRSSASLEEAFVGGNRGRVVYKLGPYVMLNMLRPRVGTENFFGALGTMLREHPGEDVTNARLQHYLERASGRDLDDFFTFWVHQGIVPKVDLTWTHRDTVVELVVTSDVPFGTFDIPVVVQGDFQKYVVPVTVKDGSGTATVEGDFRRKAKVVLDPAHRTLTRSRSVSKR